jgi:hypothetical protein
MAVFLEANSGLKSRFPNLINFPDYTGEELTKIACLQAKDKGYYIKETVLPKLQALLQPGPEHQRSRSRQRQTGPQSGGRSYPEAVRTCWCKIRGSDISELQAEDFNFTIKVTPPKPRHRSFFGRSGKYAKEVNGKGQ